MIDDEQFVQMFEGDYKGGLEEFAKEVVDHLIEDSEDRLGKERADSAAFVGRLRKKWPRSLKLTELYLHAFMDLGQKINEVERPKAAERYDVKFEAIIRNHARMVQVGREVLVLAENGYASGATARWRTMHEITVVTMFLRQQPANISERYLNHDVIESRRSAQRHKEHEVRLNCEAPTQEELDAIEKRCDELVAHYGKEFKATNGWAAPCFVKGGGKNGGKGKHGEVSFDMLEKAVGLDHWRPRYLIASQATHAPSKATYWSIAAGLMDRFLHCGASNEGLAYALHPLFLSCSMVAGCLVAEWPGEGADRLIHLHALIELERRAAVAFVEEGPKRSRN